MTSEESRLLEFATSYVHSQSDWNLGELITAVLALPFDRWPDNVMTTNGVAGVPDISASVTEVIVNQT